MNSIFDVFGYVLTKLYMFLSTASLGGAIMFYIIGSVIFVTFFHDLFVSRVLGGGS